MNGEQFYRAHRGTAIDLGILDEAGLPPWEKLSPMEQSRWDMLAYDQDLRDRTISDMLREKGVQ